MRQVNVDELRSIQLNILKYVDCFCKENHIKYFLCGGSMIGAVRHHGYIPWDDDIDIMMLRSDFERFTKTFKESSTIPYKLHTPGEEGSYYFPYSKIEDTRTIMKEHSAFPSDMGINIDLFPIDKVPESGRLQKRMYSRLSFYMNLLQLKSIIVNTERNCWKNLTLKVSHLLLRPISMKWIVKHIVDNAIVYSNIKTRYCGIAVWGYGQKEINLMSNWDETVNIAFEDMSAPIPVGYDNYLTNVYGNYMQLPPVEKRVSHHGFEAYWK